jgi:hypothetical protein
VPQNGFYNFGAAGDLQGALILASDKVYAFGQYRASLLNADLGATDGSEVVGWAGSGYNQWAPKFDADQRSLHDLASSLLSLAAQVQDATNAANAANGMSPAAGQQPVNACVPDLPKAPDHANPDGLECATPLNLYDYADRAQAQNQEILSTYIKPLQGKIDDYYAGSGSAYHSMVPQLQGLSTAPLIIDTANRVFGQCAQDDQYIYKVGIAFEGAGNAASISYSPAAGHYTPPGHSANSMAVIKMTAENYGQDISDELAANDGMQLADAMNAAQLSDDMSKQGLTSALLDAMAKSEKNPAFAAAFLNSLDPVTLLQLLTRPYPKIGSPNYRDYSGDVQALIMAALTSGSLDQQVCDAVVDYLNLPSEAPFSQQLLQELIKDPKVAAAFLTSLDEQHLHQLLAGDFKYPGTGFGFGSDKNGRQTVVFQALLSAARGMPNSTNLTAFFASVNAAMSGISSDNPDAGNPSLKAEVVSFVTYCLNNTLPPLHPGDDANLWLEQLGPQLASDIRPWVAWYARNVNNSNASSSLNETLAFGGLESLLALITGPEYWPAKILVSAGENSATSIAEQWVNSNFGNQLQGIFPVNSPVDAGTKFAEAEFGLLEFSIISEMVAAGDIIDPKTGKPVPAPVSPDATPDAKNKAIHDAIQDVLNRQDYYIVRSKNQFGMAENNTVKFDMKALYGYYYPGVTAGLVDGGS